MAEFLIDKFHIIYRKIIGLFPKIDKSYLLVALFICLCGVGIYKNHYIPAYFEQTSNYYIDESENEVIRLRESGDLLIQRFSMPFNILSGMSFKITSGSTASLRVRLVEGATRKVISQNIIGSSVQTNDSWIYYPIKKIRLKEGKEYELHIAKEPALDKTEVVLCKSNDKDAFGTALLVNGQGQNGNLCFVLHGGNSSSWWVMFSFALLITVLFLIFRAKEDRMDLINLSKDKLFVSVAVCLFYVLFMSNYAYFCAFTDEFDNIRGGILISNGYVLYRDYIVQHTPLMYYLCALFSFLGAENLQQFRLSYYILEGLIFGCLYFRHSECVGKIKMALIVLALAVLIPKTVSNFGHMILSDRFEGVCLIVLLLEYFRYLRTLRIGWVEAWIVSLSVWGCIGVAFVSLYVLIWLALFFIAIEIYSGFHGKFLLKNRVFSYGKILIALLIPITIVILYFYKMDALDAAIRQSYVFNRVVYSKYLGGFGTDVFAPFATAFRYFKSAILEVCTSGRVHDAGKISFILLLATLLPVLLCFRRKYRYLILLPIMIFGATRGLFFHGLATWYVAVFTLFLLTDKIFVKENVLFNLTIGFNNHIRLLNFNKHTCCTIVLVLFLVIFSKYGFRVSYGRIWMHPMYVSPLESYVVTHTNEYEKIGIDAFSYDSLYLLYKKRLPANKGVYMLPWYMEWYEKDNIVGIEALKPSIVVYDEERTVWGRSYFMKAFLSYLKTNYYRLSDTPSDGWTFLVWRRKVISE